MAANKFSVYSCNAGKIIKKVLSGDYRNSLSYRISILEEKIDKVEKLLVVLKKVVEDEIKTANKFLVGSNE